MVSRARGVICIILLSSCTRIGFGLDGAAPDGQPGDGVASIDAAADGWVGDARFAGNNEPCSAELGCAPGLICTPVGQGFVCRPACGDGGVCPDGQSCTPTSSVPACVPQERAGQYEDCSVIPCEDGMHCASGGAGGTTTRICFKACVDASGCAQGEDCFVGLKSGGSTCFPRCTKDADCPSTQMHCVAFGPQGTGDHCVGSIGVIAGAECSETAFCVAGTACLTTYPGMSRCRRTCGADHPCALLTDLCIASENGLVSFCFSPCDPLAAACGAGELCLPNPKVMKSICVHGEGVTGDCSDRPCVSGMMCFQGTCLPLCDSTHPCQVPDVCQPVAYQSQQTPWSVCYSGGG